MRFTVALGAVGSLAAGGLIAACSSPPAAASALSLGMADVPAGTAAVVSVTGPGGFHRAAKGTVSWRGLAPGRYVISARPVSYRGGRLFPVQPTQTVALAAGRTARATVDYADQVPASTKVLSGSGLRLAARPTAGGLVLAAGPRAGALVPGDVIVGHASALAPLGVLRKVVTVRQAAGGRLDVTTKPATLADAMPRGRIDIHDMTLAPIRADAARQRGDLGAGRATLLSRSQAASGMSGDLSFEASLPLIPPKAVPGLTVSCGPGSLPIGGDVALSFTPRIDDFQASWAPGRPPYVKFIASLEPQLDADMEVLAATGHCEVGMQQPPEAVTLEPPLEVGPTQIFNRVAMDASFSGEAAAPHYHASADVGMKITAGATFNNGSITPTWQFQKSAHFGIEPKSDSGLTLGFKYGPRWYMEAEDTFGPFLDLQPGIEAGADEVDLGVYADAGLSLNLWGYEDLTVGKVDLAALTTPIWKAAQPPTPPAASFERLSGVWQENDGKGDNKLIIFPDGNGTALGVAGNNGGGCAIKLSGQASEGYKAAVNCTALGAGTRSLPVIISGGGQTLTLVGVNGDRSNETLARIGTPLAGPVAHPPTAAFAPVAGQWRESDGLGHDVITISRNGTLQVKGSSSGCPGSIEPLTDGRYRIYADCGNGEGWLPAWVSNHGTTLTIQYATDVNTNEVLTKSG